MHMNTHIGTPRTVRNQRRRIRWMAAAVIALGTGVAACGSDDVEAITVEGQWARTSPAATTMGAAYMTLTAAEDDALVAVSVGSDVAGEAQIHETVMNTDDSMGGSMDGAMTDGMDHGSMEGDDHGGMEMSMREIDSLPLPAGQAVALEPGGYHIMLMDLTAPLEEGDSFELTLEFESGISVTVTVPIRSSAP
jgi:copper(I)-binding protein